MATGRLMKITELMSLASKRSGIWEATEWSRKLITQNPGQAVLFNSEARPENISALVHSICYAVVSFFSGEEVEQKARIFMQAIREVAIERGLEMPKESADHISAMKNALSAP